jgi:hypothetical protein
MATLMPAAARVVAVAGLSMLTIGGGCASDKAATTTAGGKSSASAKSQRLNINTDPCAMRMHDICAPMLLYFGRYQQLPDQVDELAQVPGVDVPELVCPVSGQKYIYNPHGPSGANPGTRIILYDATPAHAGHRWGIEIREPSPGQALVAKVVLVPDALSMKLPR